MIYTARGARRNTCRSASVLQGMLFWSRYGIHKPDSVLLGILKHTIAITAVVYVQHALEDNLSRDGTNSARVTPGRFGVGGLANEVVEDATDRFGGDRCTRWLISPIAQIPAP